MWDHQLSLYWISQTLKLLTTHSSINNRLGDKHARAARGEVALLRSGILHYCSIQKGHGENRTKSDLYQNTLDVICWIWGCPLMHLVQPWTGVSQVIVTFLTPVEEEKWLTGYRIKQNPWSSSIIPKFGWVLVSGREVIPGLLHKIYQSVDAQVLCLKYLVIAYNILCITPWILWLFTYQIEMLYK